MRRVIRSVFGTLPAKWQGRIDYYLRPRSHDPWGGPFNGQVQRRLIVEEILRKCNVGAIVETGTYRGVTTAWLTRFGLPVVSIEINPRYFAFSTLRLRQVDNVELHLGNSVALLPFLLSPGRYGKGPIFFYLDAHGQDDLPLREELSLIFEARVPSIVMIDDFQVPSDSGYGYDNYGESRSLSLDYLAPLQHHGFRSFFPTALSSQETGSRRGSLVVTVDSAIAETLGGIRALRRHDPE